MRQKWFLYFCGVYDQSQRSKIALICYRCFSYEAGFVVRYMWLRWRHLKSKTIAVCEGTHIMSVMWSGFYLVLFFLPQLSRIITWVLKRHTEQLKILHFDLYETKSLSLILCVIVCSLFRGRVPSKCSEGDEFQCSVFNYLVCVICFY